MIGEYRGPTLVRADARKREWFACNGVGMRAVSRAPLNKALDDAPLIANHVRPFWIAIKLFLSGILLLPLVAAVSDLLYGDSNPLDMLPVALFFGLLAVAPWVLPKWLSPALISENDLEHQPLPVFFRQAVLRTVEGWIWAATTAAYLSAALYLLWPVPVVGRHELPWANILVFALWPILSFIVFVVLCSPHYTSSIFSTVFVAIFSLVGFWLLLT